MIKGGQMQIKRPLTDEMARERAEKDTECSWPDGFPTNPKYPGLCDPGRTFTNQNVDSIPDLVGTMMKDPNHYLSTTIHLEIKVHPDGEKADIRVLRQTNEWCVPYTFPASMLSQYIRSFWNQTDRLDDGGVMPMRIICYQGGRFWEEPRYRNQRTDA